MNTLELDVQEVELLIRLLHKNIQKREAKGKDIGFPYELRRKLVEAVREAK